MRSIEKVSVAGRWHDRRPPNGATASLRCASCLRCASAWPGSAGDEAVAEGKPRPPRPAISGVRGSPASAPSDRERPGDPIARRAHRLVPWLDPASEPCSMSDSPWPPDPEPLLLPHWPLCPVVELWPPTDACPPVVALLVEPPMPVWPVPCEPLLVEPASS